jgi:hypothetical protein
MQFHNEIVPFGSLDKDGNPIKGNADESIHSGAEFSAKAKLHRYITMSGNISYSHNYFKVFQLENWDEIDMETSDVEYNLKRCFYQSLRSCRQVHYINEPNQEWLEQMGINPSFVQHEMLSFLNHERTVMDEMTKKGEGFGDDMTAVDEFVDHLTTKYREMPVARIKSRGMKTAIYDKWAFKDDKREQQRLSSNK